MVRDEGREQGIGIWDVANHQAIGTQIREAVDTFDHPTELQGVYVFGSFGGGVAVRRASDLDVVVSVILGGVIAGDELRSLQQELADHVEAVGIGTEYDAFTTMDVQVADPARTQDILAMYSGFESVDTYYDLLSCQRLHYR